LATDDDLTGLLDLSKGRAAELKQLLDDTVVTALVFSPDGRYLGLGSEEGILHVFESRRPDDEIARLRHSGRVTAVAFSDNGRHVATASSAQNRFDPTESYPLRVWLLQPNELLAEAAARLKDLRRDGRLPGP
jgi:WD40 repeat protein